LNRTRGLGANVWDLIRNQIIFQLENTIDRVHGLVNHCGMAVYEHPVDHRWWWPRARRSPALRPLWWGKPHCGLGKRRYNDGEPYQGWQLAARQLFLLYTGMLRSGHSLIPIDDVLQPPASKRFTLFGCRLWRSAKGGQWSHRGGQLWRACPVAAAA
jgi:hypothetical protein